MNPTLVFAKSGLRKPLLLALAAGFAIVFTVTSYAWLRSHPGNHNFVPSIISTKSKSALAATAWNETLGFSKVLYISMPYRTDRQDAMNLLASMSDIKIKLILGVDGDSINAKAVPDKADLRASVLGCWRAHADAWRDVIDNNFETALILEDDIDWDENIHQIFHDLSLQMQNNKLRLVKPTDHERASAPYGLDWDVLFLGQCLDQAHPDHRDLVQIYDDPNVPSRKDTQKVFLDQMESLGVEGDDVGKKRLLSPAYGPACTMGYAISRKGAQRLLLNLSYLGLRGPVDNDMAWTLQDGKIRGYTVTPPLFAAWRVGGQKDSDNYTPNPNEAMAENGNRAGLSQNLKSSARVAMVGQLAMDNWGDYVRKGLEAKANT
ncbi:hypothetical protein V1520DRAFT_347566 [Lipomyces starkeyi]|uniref:Glycosyl transferase family 25 domain-containing protein n=1 Tax=Lipomyces starkeyi NRRL Y-11557 TaxID=675824 RepID=A0A1E3Q454_LIPST|nr:hypothetical protein LIPSTDRAFT_71862 [Lipomyces starkeyi NRRL Y-11557]